MTKERQHVLLKELMEHKSEWTRKRILFEWVKGGRIDFLQFKSLVYYVT